ncbi:major facilitator superfamily domain-containing protein [Roridomyces roridus]|uniref:Major facilitator superfamily domain-containing protein n=1 Tax=Roridomyces roridus TaxID=1738132 RepID=A0AAD7BL01_9AGAR|nr:major facilitator superfamily domain-containing protein [Roridomyces roridus]
MSTGLAKWRLNSPLVQNYVGGIVLALTPGIFTALGALGSGGGRASSTHLASVVSSTLYAIYTFSGWGTGIFLNTIGPRWTLTIGAIGYPVYVAAFWYYDATGHQWFPILSGVILGFSAGLLWSTSAYLGITYSTEAERGKYIAIQGVITGIGATIGSAVGFGLSANSTSSDGVPTTVYAIFLSLMCCGSIVAASFIINPANIVRDDGTKIALFTTTETTTFWQEFKGVVDMTKDLKLMLLVPVMFAAEFPVAIEPSLNAYAFNLRTRTLLGLLYSIAQIPGVLIFVPLLDNNRMTRRTRGLVGLAALSLLVLGAWCGQLGWMAGKNLDRSIAGPAYDWTDGAPFVGFAILYIIFGALYVCYSMVAIWIMSAMTNSPTKLARHAGLFKGTVSAGMSVVFGIDSTLLPFRHELAYCFALQMLGLVIMAYLCVREVKNTKYFLEDDVIVPIEYVEREQEIDPELAAHERKIHPHDKEFDEKA